MAHLRRVYSNIWESCSRGERPWQGPEWLTLGRHPSMSKPNETAKSVDCEVTTTSAALTAGCRSFLQTGCTMTPLCSFESGYSFCLAQQHSLVDKLKHTCRFHAHNGLIAHTSVSTRFISAGSTG